MKSKILFLGVFLALVIGLLAACGGITINDAKSLAAANKEAQSKVENFHADSDIDINMSLGMEGLESLFGSGTMTVPMKMNISLDSGRESAHGNMSTDISFMGQSEKTTAEIYCDLKNGKAYVKAEGSDEWEESEQSNDYAAMLNSISELSDDILENCEFKEEDNAYTLTMNAEVLGETIDDLGLLNDAQAAGEVDLSDLDIKSGQIVYSFDKETVLISKIDMDNIKIKASGSMEGTEYDLDMDMKGSYSFSKYGELKPADFEIPAEVTGGAGAGSDDGKKSDATDAATKADAGGGTSGDLPKATTQLTVSGASTPDDQGWYVVGQDSIPAGTYRLYHGDGKGALKLKTSSHETLGEYSIGFNDDSKELTDGTEFTLNRGDLVFITKDLAVVFDPVN